MQDPAQANCRKSHLSHALLHVVVLGTRVVQVVLGRVEATHGAVGSANERVSTSLVSRNLPEHAAAKSLLLEVVDLGLDHVGSIKGNKSLGSSIVGVATLGGVIALNSSAGLGKSLVVPDTILPASITNTVEGLAETLSLGESAAVDGHTEDNLVGGNTTLNISIDSHISAERSGISVIGVRVQVGVVAGGVAPRAGVVVGHQVNVVKNLTDLLEVERSKVLRASRRSHGELEVVATGALAKVVQFSADSLEEKNHVASFSIVLGVLPVW